MEGMVKMKKIVSIMLVLALAFSVTSVFAANTEIIIDGVKAEIPDGLGKIVEKNARTFVPVRFLLDYMGFNVEWENDSQTVIGTSKDSTRGFILQVGNKTIFSFDATSGKLQEKSTAMDVEPFINNQEDRVYVPIRFIAEQMGYDVGWDGETETVTLIKKN